MTRTLIIILTLILTCPLESTAQKRERKKADKQAVSESTQTVNEYEQMLTEGWMTIDTKKSLQEGYERFQTLEDMTQSEGDEKTRRYVTSTATCEHPSLNTALSLAKTKAKRDIASQMEATVDVTTVNVDKTGDESTSIMGPNIDKRASANLSKVEEVLSIYRKKDDGKYEVRVFMAYDLTKMEK